MKQKKSAACAGGLNRKKKTMILALIFGVLILFGMIVGVLYHAYGGKGTTQGMLEIFFGTKYSHNGKSFDDMSGCMAPELQALFSAKYSAGGTNFSQLNMWRMEAENLVGANVSVAVEVQAEEDGNASDLSTVRETCPSAELARYVLFHITLTGDNGYMKVQGIAECIRVKGNWYLINEEIELTTFEREVEEE